MEQGINYRLLYIMMILLSTVNKSDADMTIATADGSNTTVDEIAKNSYKVSMDENNHSWNSKPTPLFTILNVHGQPTVKVDGTMFVYQLKETEKKTMYILYANQSFDYETQEHEYSFNIIDNEGTVFVKLIIINIDDESPSLTSPQCNFDEYTLYNKDNSPCSCTLHDPDGWLSKTTFEIITSKKIDGEEDEKGIFDLKFKEVPPDDVYTTEVYVIVQKKLDYAKKMFYLFDIKAEDSAHHPTVPNALVRAIVYVVDLRNLPPKWNSVFAFQQFKEEQEMTFKVQARDGDTGINSPVYYNITYQDDVADNYVSIKPNGEIDVKKIDRDKNDISTYNFQIKAYVIDNEVPGDWSTTQNITFFIIDIDDNPPIIEKLTNETSQSEIPLDKRNKVLKLSFYENYKGGMNTSIFIRDIDTGENAQFTVELEKAGTKIDYTEAFMIVPNAGYRKSNFDISVRNASYLDYEVPEWDNIKFNVLVRGVKDPKKIDRMLVNISLLDYNDEWPIFAKDEYSVKINETTKKDFFIIQVLATDRDKEDKILKHSLLGANRPLELLRIESATGKIFAAIDNAFDYDTLNPIFVQVRATDKVGHKATVPLTIDLLDVNNKAPVITVNKPISVEENQVIGIPLNSSITATDPDTNAELIANIDWDNSYATKNSRRLDMTDDTIAKQVMFLDIKVTKTNPEEKTRRHIKIDLIVNDRNPDQTTPDFELFDSLYLSLIVTDLNTNPEFMDKQNTSSIILIGIIDINDNTPYFPEANMTIRPNRTVLEEAPYGTSVGSIIAIDLDVGDIVTYECSASHKKYDWLTVDTKNGAITVKKDNAIDADSGPTYYFAYYCTASDGVHTSDILKVQIYIIDTNNKCPIISIPDKISVDEKSDADTLVNTIGESDKDRDEPFHTVQCTINKDKGKCGDKFFIDKANRIRVTNGKDDIDRDHGTLFYNCTMNCVDNPELLRNDNRQHSVPGTFTITLNDINDNTPELLTDEIETWEDIKKGDIISEVFGRDIDAGENGTIIFEILKIEKPDSDENYLKLFTLPQESYVKVNETDKKVNLVAAVDLGGYYGDYKVTFNLRDNGTIPNIANYSAKLTINKFNFFPPRFVYPADKESFTLFSSQTMNKPLSFYKKNENIRNFQIADSVDKDGCEKWDIALDTEQVQPKDEATIFILAKQKTCEFQLQVNKRFNKKNVVGTQYQLKLIATINNQKPKDGEAPYSSDITVTISFMDNNLKPIFTVPGNTWSFDMLENDVTLSQKLIYPASYPGVQEKLHIFYYLVADKDDDAAEFFVVDKSTGTISLKRKLDYESKDQFQFRICASNDTQPTSNNQLSYLKVTVNVIDVNAHVPQWTRKEFYGALMTGYRTGSPLVTLEATDADKIDQGKLTYYMSDKIERYGKGIDNILKPFLLDTISGVITLNFQMDNTMSGYFRFDVTVKDVEDQWHNGPFSNTTKTTIFIITKSNTVHFRFANTVEEVRDHEYKMLKIISRILQVEAYRQTIDKKSEGGVEFNDETIASLYFVQSSATAQLQKVQQKTSIAAVDAKQILRRISKFSTFTKLYNELQTQTNLTLLSFSPIDIQTDDTQQVVQAWLIGVSVVTGTLCVAILMIFILKTRQLNRRIVKLTEKRFGSQESGLNRLGIAAPTTNKHAIEGSNPIFSLDEVKKGVDFNDLEFDRKSVASGDSDLIGVEENPEFDMTFQQNLKLNGTTNHI